MLCFGLYTYVKATESRAAAIAGKSAVVQALVSAQPAEERCAPSPRLGALGPPPPPPPPPHTRASRPAPRPPHRPPPPRLAAPYASRSPLVYQGGRAWLPWLPPFPPSPPAPLFPTGASK